MKYYVSIIDGEEYKIKWERKRVITGWAHVYYASVFLFFFVCLYNVILQDNPCPFVLRTRCTNSQIHTNMYYDVLHDRNNYMSLRSVSLREIGMWVFIRETALVQRIVLAADIKCIYKRDYRPTRSMRLCKLVDSPWKIAAKCRKQRFPVVPARFEYSLRIALCRLVMMTQSHNSAVRYLGQKVSRNRSRINFSLRIEVPSFFTENRFWGRRFVDIKNSILI